MFAVASAVLSNHIFDIFAFSDEVQSIFTGQTLQQHPQQLLSFSVSVHFCQSNFVLNQGLDPLEQFKMSCKCEYKYIAITLTIMLILSWCRHPLLIINIFSYLVLSWFLNLLFCCNLSSCASVNMSTRNGLYLIHLTCCSIGLYHAIRC